MTTTNRQNSISIATDSGRGTLSSQLLAILTQQVELARAGKLDEVMTLAGKVDELLHHADPKELQSALADGAVRALHDKLSLMIGAAKSDAAREMEKVGKGRNSLQAYKTTYNRV